MQTDMHYFGTYSIARAAGLRSDVARAIATAAEYVDDSDHVDVVCTDGFEIHSRATAHHPTDFKHNTDPEDQRKTWVPFHFIPGAVGDTVEQKLVCVTDSQIAQDVVRNTIANLEQPFGVPLLGILAHSYMDTFSHYGFSGISSPVNKVDTESFELSASDSIVGQLEEKFGKFVAKYAVGPLANFLVQLGHGSVATYPDQPYLAWRFKYLEPERQSDMRENQKTFLAACERLYDVFLSAKEAFNGQLDDDNSLVDFKDIRAAVAGILAIEENDVERSVAWQNAMRAGRISRTAEEIPAYDSSMFTSDLNRLSDYDERFARTTLVFLFLQAADFHRDYLLNKLLPASGIHMEAAPIQWHGGEQ